MGCCVSSSATADADQKDEPVSCKNTAPPPSVAEEKTVVKEVLSETTLLTDDNYAVETTTKISEDEEKKPGVFDVAPDPVLTDTGSIDPEKKSEVLEICSLSESLLSIVNGHEEEEVKQRKFQELRQRSPAKSRNRVMVNYPTQRTDISPRKRNTEGASSVRLLPSGTGKRDPTERSEGRRSRSPATNRSVMDPTRYQYSTDSFGTRRKKGQSPGRVRPDPNKNGSDQDCHYLPSCGAAGGNYNSTPNKPFENPLVSLECFIFL